METVANLVVTLDEEGQPQGDEEGQPQGFDFHDFGR
jgi:hypothetical protein